MNPSGRGIVTGASRGLGRLIASRLTSGGMSVVGLARDADVLGATAAELGVRFEAAVGDATDRELAAELLTAVRPDLVVLNAGAVPIMGSITQLSWADFATNFDVDVRHVFEWLAAVDLVRPVSPTRIVVMSSGAALNGSPLSGSYAGAKATVRFMADYAASTFRQAGLPVTIATLLPRMTTDGAVGRAGAEAYNRGSGITSAAPATSGYDGLAVAEAVWELGRRQDNGTYALDGRGGVAAVTR